MKHPRVCRECEFWVVIEEDDGYCRRPVPRAATDELPPGEEKELLENADCKQD
ncbi:MAG: hypothetical protein HZB86_08315 [Deltaproteobacteria bacterium]|nr:hypothetical protein [Deltaproteobacteria bacterium]